LHEGIVDVLFEPASAVDFRGGRLGGILQGQLALRKCVDAPTAWHRSQQRGGQQVTAVQALRAHGVDGAVDGRALSRPFSRNRYRDENQGHVLCIFQFLKQILSSYSSS